MEATGTVVVGPAADRCDRVSGWEKGCHTMWCGFPPAVATRCTVAIPHASCAALCWSRLIGAVGQCGCSKHPSPKRQGHTYCMPHCRPWATVDAPAITSILSIMQLDPPISAITCSNHGHDVWAQAPSELPRPVGAPGSSPTSLADVLQIADEAGATPLMICGET